MSLRALTSVWTIDSEAMTLLGQLAALAALYVAAVAHGNRTNRSRRRWPRRRTVCFLAGLAVAGIDLCSGIGTQADSRLSAHMLEHMIIWLIVAPLLAAAAPVRLAFYSLPRASRRRLAQCLRSRAISTLTGTLGAVSVFSLVLPLTHVPAVYGLTLTNQYAHEAEHALYLITALLVWAPLIGADPLPHRPSARRQIACTSLCMVPMLLIAVWLALAPHPVYLHYLAVLGPKALHDQRLAATIMWAGCLPAFAVPAVARAAQRPSIRPSSRGRLNRVPA